MYIDNGRNFLWKGNDASFADDVAQIFDRFLKKLALGMFDMLLDAFKHSFRL